MNVKTPCIRRTSIHNVFTGVYMIDPVRMYWVARVTISKVLTWISKLEVVRRTIWISRFSLIARIAARCRLLDVRRLYTAGLCLMVRRSIDNLSPPCCRSWRWWRCYTAALYTDTVASSSSCQPGFSSSSIRCSSHRWSSWCSEVATSECWMVANGYLLDVTIGYASRRCLVDAARRSRCTFVYGYLGCRLIACPPAFLVCPPAVLVVFIRRSLPRFGSAGVLFALGCDGFSRRALSRLWREVVGQRQAGRRWAVLHGRMFGRVSV